MKKILLASLLVLACGSAYMLRAQKPAPSPLEIGAQLPARTVPLHGADGREYTLEKLRTKKGLIVMFSCNTCPYVIKSQQRTKEAMRMAREKGLGMVIVNSNTSQRANEDSYDAMIAYAKDQGYTVPYIADQTQLASLFGATRTPEVFLFDEKAALVYHGAMEDNPTEPSKSQKLYLNSAVNNMLAGKAPEPAFTKSIGCSIKNK